MAETQRAGQEGRLRLHPQFASRFLAPCRDVLVYVPPGYDESDGRYPVLYLQDGQNLFDPSTAFGGQDWRADVTADEMIRNGEIEPLIMVGVYHTGAPRVSEYTPTRDRGIRKGGKAGKYARVLAREIKPFIDRQYRTLKAARHTAVGGSSLGGLAALVAGLEYSRVFGGLAILSPSVWWDGRSILTAVRDFRSPSRPRVWLDAGTAEGDTLQAAVEDARFLRDTLIENGWREGTDLEYHEIQGASHNEAAWGARFGKVLAYMFPPR